MKKITLTAVANGVTFTRNTDHAYTFVVVSAPCARDVANSIESANDFTKALATETDPSRRAWLESTATAHANGAESKRADMIAGRPSARSASWHTTRALAEKNIAARVAPFYGKSWIVPVLPTSENR